MSPILLGIAAAVVVACLVALWLTERAVCRLVAKSGELAKRCEALQAFAGGLLGRSNALDTRLAQVERTALELRTRVNALEFARANERHGELSDRAVAELNQRILDEIFGAHPTLEDIDLDDAAIH